MFSAEYLLTNALEVALGNPRRSLGQQNALLALAAQVEAEVFPLNRSWYEEVEQSWEVVLCSDCREPAEPGQTHCGPCGEDLLSEAAYSLGER